MKKINDQMLKQWVEERDEAVLSFDLDKFKAFYKKWSAKGFYDKPLPSDEVVEITIRKMVLGLKNPPKDKVKEAKQWLIEHNCRPWF